MSLTVFGSRWFTRRLPLGPHGLRFGVPARYADARPRLEAALNLVAEFAPETLEYLRHIGLSFLVAYLRGGNQLRLHRFTPTLTFTPEFLKREPSTLVAQEIVFQTELARLTPHDPWEVTQSPEVVAEATRRARAILGHRPSQ